MKLFLTAEAQTLPGTPSRDQVKDSQYVQNLESFYATNTVIKYLHITFQHNSFFLGLIP